VNGKRRPSVLTKVLGQVVGDPLRTDEDEDLGVLRRDLLKVLDELAALLKVGADLDDLSDVEVGRELEGTDGDLDEVLEVGVGELLYLLGPGSGEHEGLTVRADLKEKKKVRK
jgi:hypothetical protein